MDGTEKVQRGKRKVNRDLRPKPKPTLLPVDPLAFDPGGRLASFLSTEAEMKYLELAEIVSHVDILQENVFEEPSQSADREGRMVHLYSFRVRPMHTDRLEKLFCEKNVAAWEGRSNQFRWLEEGWGEFYEDRFVEPEELKGHSGKSVNSKY